jgi:hypothetical protein
MEYIGWAVGQEMLEGTEQVAQSLFERCLRILIVHELRALLCLACAFSSLMMSAVNFGLLNRPKPRVAGYSVFHMVAVALTFTGRGHKSLFQARNSVRFNFPDARIGMRNCQSRVSIA